MSGLEAVGLVGLGLVLLAFGGDALVRGATRVARRLGLTPAVIGLTIVAMGTSLPELVVSLVAAKSGRPDLAVGNALGSNIFNVTAALGLTAAIAVLPVRAGVLRTEWPAMFVATLAAVVFLQDAHLGRAEGGILLAGLVGFTAWAVRLARREVSAEVATEFAEELEERAPAAADRIGTAVLALAGGLVLLVLGGRWLVAGASELARLAGMTERVIGLTVVAAGTGAPEVATSVMAALRRHTDVAVANMIGSNLFNLLGILGGTALLAPIDVSRELVTHDAWWVLGTSVLLLPVLVAGRRVRRWEGGLLVGVYILYLALLVG